MRPAAQAERPAWHFHGSSIAIAKFLENIKILPFTGNRSRGLLIAGGVVFPCALGRAGIVHGKREGDGGTPAGVLRLVEVLYRADRVARPLTRLPLRPIRPDDGWCDDPADRLYNRPVQLPYPASHERLWRDDRLYDLVVVLDWNLARPRPGAGSAIFFHLASPGFGPTAGCVAVSEETMRKVLRRAGRGTRLVTRPGVSRRSRSRP